MLLPVMKDLYLEIPDVWFVNIIYSSNLPRPFLGFCVLGANPIFCPKVGTLKGHTQRKRARLLKALENITIEILSCIALDIFQDLGT